MTTPNEIVNRIAVDDATPEEHLRTAAIRALLEATEYAHKEYDDEEALRKHVLALYRNVVAFGTNLQESMSCFVAAI